MSTEPSGYWQIESDVDLSQRQWHELRAGLERATLEGQTIAVINGITLKWREAVPECDHHNEPGWTTWHESPPDEYEGGAQRVPCTRA